MSRRVITCIVCDRQKPYHALEMCSKCYKRSRHYAKPHLPCSACNRHRRLKGNGLCSTCDTGKRRGYKQCKRCKGYRRYWSEGMCQGCTRILQKDKSNTNEKYWKELVEKGKMCDCDKGPFEPPPLFLSTERGGYWYYLCASCKKAEMRYKEKIR